MPADCDTNISRVLCDEKKSKKKTKSVFISIISFKKWHIMEYRGLHDLFCWGSGCRCRLHLPARSGFCPYRQNYQNLLWCPCHHSAQLANALDLNPIYKRGTRLQNKEELMANIKNIWTTTPLHCHKLIASMPWSIDYPFKAKINIASWKYFIFIDINGS